MSKETKVDTPLVNLRDELLKNHDNFGRVFLGQVLTIVDASIADPEQRKGIKDLINNTYYSNSVHRQEMAYILSDWAYVYGKEDVRPQTSEERAYLEDFMATPVPTNRTHTYFK